MSPVHRAISYTAVAGYLSLAAVAWVNSGAPRIFWTGIMPLIPVAIVVAGFGRFRSVCPIAMLGSLFRAKRRRRVPPWLTRAPLSLALAGLGFALSVRHVAANGDGRVLSAVVVALPALAAVVNRRFGGRAWCQYLCPVGVVERIYTDGGAIVKAPARLSACAPCTGCMKSCPDLGPERAGIADVLSSDRRRAFYAYPGLILAFYGYYYLRTGTFEAYFDGRWTEQPAAEAMSGSGLFFWPWVSPCIAAPAALLLGSALGVLAFSAVERGLRRFEEPLVARRHGLALASFAAFNVFYVFAGAPSLRLLPGATRIVAFAAPVVATLVLVNRWREVSAKLRSDKPSEETSPSPSSRVRAAPRRLTVIA